MFRTYSGLERKIKEIQAALKSALEARQAETNHRAVFDWEILKQNISLLFWGLTQNVFKFLIIIFSSPASSFTLFFNPNPKEACPYSFNHFKSVHRKVKTYSALWLLFLASGVTIVSLVLNLIFGYRQAGRAESPDAPSPAGQALSKEESDSAGPLRSKSAFERISGAVSDQARLSFTTDRAAACRYATEPGQDFSGMVEAFSSEAGGTNHFLILTDLADGQNFNFYARCQDQAGNKNLDDYPLSLSVQVQDGTPIFLLQKMDFPAGR